MDNLEQPLTRNGAVMTWKGSELNDNVPTTQVSGKMTCISSESQISTVNRLKESRVEENTSNLVEDVARDLPQIVSWYNDGTGRVPKTFIHHLSQDSQHLDDGSQQSQTVEHSDTSGCDLSRGYESDAETSPNDSESTIRNAETSPTDSEGTITDVKSSPTDPVSTIKNAKSSLNGSESTIQNTNLPSINLTEEEKRKEQNGCLPVGFVYYTRECLDTLQSEQLEGIVQSMRKQLSEFSDVLMIELKLRDELRMERESRDKIILDITRRIAKECVTTNKTFNPFN